MRDIDGKPQATLVRKALKKLYPGIKFSVRLSRYSMGSSVTASWTDGPFERSVKKNLEAFDGTRFDGMCDYGYHVQSWLMPDGTATLGRSPGSRQGPGTHQGYEHEAPHADAELVRFSSSLQLSRSASEQARGVAAAEVAEEIKAQGLESNALALAMGGDEFNEDHWYKIDGELIWGSTLVHQKINKFGRYAHEDPEWKEPSE